MFEGVYVSMLLTMVPFDQYAITSENLCRSEFL